MLVSLLAWAEGNAQPLRLEITPGIGHDRFTETFFLDDSTSVSPDSLEQIKKTQSDLQESYASLGLAGSTKNWRIENTVYATNKAWRDIANGHGRWAGGKWKTDFDGRLEWKGRTRGDTAAASYTYARLSATPQLRISDVWSLVSAGDWEMTDYLRNTSYTYGYNRLRGQIGASYFGDLMQSLDARIGISRRAVPDSSELGYTEGFLRLDASGWQMGRWRLEGDFSFANREYQAAGDESDYHRWSAGAGVDYDWSKRWRTSLQSSWQYWDYRLPDEINFSLHDVRSEGSVRLSLSDQWETGAAVEVRLERAVDDSLSSNNYVQWAAGPRIVWNSGLTVWSELTPRLGHRSYADGSSVYDDYSFWDLLLQADAAGPAGSTASATITYSSERHADRSRDAAYLYLALSLRFPIKI